MFQTAEDNWSLILWAQLIDCLKRTRQQVDRCEAATQEMVALTGTEMMTVIYLNRLSHGEIFKNIDREKLGWRNDLHFCCKTFLFSQRAKKPADSTVWIHHIYFTHTDTDSFLSALLGAAVTCEFPQISSSYLI